MKLLLVGGGGHLVPLFSVLQQVSSKDTVLIVGRKHALEGDRAVSLEYITAETYGIPFQNITAGRIQRKFTQHTIVSLCKIPYGIFQAFSIVKEFRPDVTLSGGGYVAFPITIASFFLGIPVVIHEQTQEAGLVNRITALFAAKICISWESSKKFFPKKKTVLTGNPVQEFSGSISNIRKKYHIDTNDLPILYITGGSLGSHAINELVEGCIETLLQTFCVLHQTGDAQEYGDYDRLVKKRSDLSSLRKKRYMLTKFVDPDDVGGVLQITDLVISRCGINTISELLYYKKPALLIPIPVSQRNEQNKNALLLQQAGLAEIADQTSLSSEKLCKTILAMKGRLADYKIINNRNSFLIVNAAENILTVIRSVINYSPLPYDPTQKK